MTRPKVLIEIAADGFVQAYAPDTVDIKIINRPIASTANDGNVVDQLIDEVLPQCYADVYWPVNVRATAMVEQITPDDLQRRVCNQELIATLNGDKPRKSHLILTAIGG